MESELQQLEQRVQGLIDWKRKREKERFIYPLDHSSKVTLNKGLFVTTGRIFPFPLTGLAYLITYDWEIKINDKVRQLIVTLPLLPFTVNATTNVFTNTNGQHNLKDGDRVGFTSTSLLPSPLDEITIYYIINQTGNKFEVATSFPGSAVNITDIGLGDHYWVKIP